MNNREARSILLLYRPGTADRDDPDVQEALALAETDEELGRWFKEHCAVQTALRAKFAQIPVPEGLKEQILAESNGHPAFGFRMTPALLAACVTVVLVIVGAWAHFGRRDQTGDAMSSFRNRMVGIVQRQYPEMDLTTNDLGAIKRYLAQKDHGGYALPAALSKAAPTGCKLLAWHSRPVSMICFNSGKTSDPSQPDLFLFVIDRSAVANAPPPSSPQMAQPTRRFATATWSNAEKTYVLGGLGDEEFLKRFL